MNSARRGLLTLMLVSVLGINWLPAADAAVKVASAERSLDTHAIDEVPYFDEDEDPVKAVEKTAERQLKESIEEPPESIPPRGAGTVLTTKQEKTEAVNESTKVVTDGKSASEQVAGNSHRPTIALALGGGGARGAAHIGVLRALKEANIPIDYIVGNSMGAIVGGLYAAGVPLDKIETLIADESLRRAYMGSVPAKLLVKPIEKCTHPFKKHYAGLWTGKKFGQFLEKQLPPGVKNVEDTIIPFSAVATNLLDGKAYRISDGKLSTAIRASSSIPAILQPVAVGDKLFVDGAIRANLPASAARDTGADIVIAVLVDEPIRKQPASKFRSLSGITTRLGDIMLAMSDSRQLPFADIVINPDVSGLPVLGAKPEDAIKAVGAGEAATRKALPAINKIMADSTKRLAAKSKPANTKVR